MKRNKGEYTAIQGNAEEYMGIQGNYVSNRGGLTWKYRNMSLSSVGIG